MIYQFSRNNDEKICFRLREYKDKSYIDLRIFFKSKQGDEMFPTKKGITVSLEHLPELKKGISLCEKKVSTLVQ
ncbi:MAG: hypothetical protein A3C35_06125 [Omnitrophica bacterium RIFCSPHIGHO2_02_FULL_46_11]|nr:MAG: hypothetical protein A3C35_06125 [Omnitrophica bacterium RIFCSPHIGHO2_02_FULL_46_11]